MRLTQGQIDDLVKKSASARPRVSVLVTTLTKRMAEDLTEYLAELNIKVHYLHSDIHTIERVEILATCVWASDVVVGINLLREGLDLPEVSLVAVLDADKEGFCAAATTDPDDRPCGAPHRGQGSSLCGQDDRLDEPGN